MTVIEGFLAVFLLLAALARLWPTLRTATPRHRFVLLLVLGLLLVLQLTLSGPRWQVLPLYLAAAVELWSLASPPWDQLWNLPWNLVRTQPSHQPRPSFLQPSPLPALTMLLLTTLSAALCWALPLFSLPAPTGPYTVGERTLYLTDTSRDAEGRPAAPGMGTRQIPVTLWYPAAPSAGGGDRARYAAPQELTWRTRYQGQIRTNALQDAPPALAGRPFPVLLFGHKWGGRRTQDTFLAEDLASHGFVVAAPDHPGNTPHLLLQNGMVLRFLDHAAALDRATSPGEVRALWTRELAIWTADNEFILNSLQQANTNPDSPLHHLLDLSRVGAFGHSFGGAAALALLGRDPRVQAAANLDGWTFEALDHRTAQPVLLLYESAITPADPESATKLKAETAWQAGPDLPGDDTEDQLDRQDHAAIRQSLQRAPLSMGFLLGTQHADFTDQTLASPIQRLTLTGPLAPNRVRTLVRAAVLSFFQQTLTGCGTLPEAPELRWAARAPSPAHPCTPPR